MNQLSRICVLILVCVGSVCAAAITVSDNLNTEVGASVGGQVVSVHIVSPAFTNPGGEVSAPVNVIVPVGSNGAFSYALISNAGTTAFYTLTYTIHRTGNGAIPVDSYFEQIIVPGTSGPTVSLLQCRVTGSLSRTGDNTGSVLVPTILGAQNRGAFLRSDNNLTDVASVPAARAALGLTNVDLLNPSGNGPSVATTTGTLVPGHLAVIDAFGNFIDSGSAGSSYTLTPATSSGLGGIIVPTGGPLAVDGSGHLTISVGTGATQVPAGNDSRITGAAQKSANLSDLASASTARTNLGILSAGTHAATDFALAASVGAASGIAPLNSSSIVPSVNLPPIQAPLGFTPLNAASNLTDLVSASAARTALGLGTAALSASSAFATPASVTAAIALIPTTTSQLTNNSNFIVSTNNLSEVNAAASRTNLGISTVGNTGAYADLTGKPTIPSAYTLPPATTTTLGGVIVPSSSALSADVSGNLTAKIGTTSGTLTAGNDARVANALLDPGSNGLLKRTGAEITAIAGVSDLPTGYLYSNLSGAPTLYNQLVFVAGVSAIQRPKLDFEGAGNVTIAKTDNGSDTTTLTITGTSPGGTVTHSLGGLTTGQLIVGNGAGDVKVGDLAGDATTSGSNAVTVPKINGTSVPVNSAANQLLLTTGSATGAWATVPSCLDTVGQHLNYDPSTHTLVCGTTGGAAGSAGFSGLTGGTNTSANMIVGSGAFLSPSGGTIQANSYAGTLLASNLPTPSTSTLGGIQAVAGISHQWINSISNLGVPALSQPAFTDISGSVAASQIPNPSATTLGGIQSATASSHQFFNALSTSGVLSSAQPAAADITGLAASATTDTTSGTNITSGTVALARLPTSLVLNTGANTYTGVAAPSTPGAGLYTQWYDTTSTNVLSSINPAGVISNTVVAGTAGANQWMKGISRNGVLTFAQPDFSNLTGSISSAQIPLPGASSVGGVQALTSTSHFVVNSLSTSGILGVVQLSASDILGLATSATTDTTSATNITAGTLSAARLPATVVQTTQTNTYANQAAPATPASGNTTVYTDATNKTLVSRNDAGNTSTTVFPATAGTHQFSTGLNSNGTVSFAQPAFTDVSGSVAAAQLPNPGASSLGGIQSRTAVTSNWINSISTSGVPSLAQPAFADISGVATGAQLPNPSASVLGGVKSLTAVSKNYLTSIGTNGLPTQAQPVSSDLSDWFSPPTTVIASLPSASGNTGKIYIATDATTGSDCTTGSGALRSWCYSNGTTWVSVGGGLTGNIPIGNLNSGTGASSTTFLRGDSPFGVWANPFTASAAGSHQFANGENSSGALLYAQPAFTDISGTATTGQVPNPAATIRTISTSSTALVSDATILCDATSGAVTITLPTSAAAYTNSKGGYVTVKKVDASGNACIVSGNGSVIDNALTVSLPIQYATGSFQPNGTQWYTVGDAIEDSNLAGGSGSGAVWSSLSSPNANLSLNMGANTSTFTWGAATGSGVNAFSINDSASNTGTGNLLDINTASGSALNPLQVQAQSGTPSLQVLANGNVGIGVAVPGSPFEIDNGGGILTYGANTLKATSTSTASTILGLGNTSSGGNLWQVLSTGASNASGASRLDLYNQTNDITALDVFGSTTSPTVGTNAGGALGWWNSVRYAGTGTLDTYLTRSAAGTVRVNGASAAIGNLVLGNENLTNQSAPSAPPVGTVAVYSDSTNQILNVLTNSSATSTTVIPSSSGANQFARGLANGALIYAQPAFTNLSGQITSSQIPNPSATTLGGIESFAAIGHSWINSISTSGVPAATQPAFSDISGVAAAAQLPNPTSSTLGGTQSVAPVLHNWVNSISTSGVPAISQPAASDLSNGTTGTGGAVVLATAGVLSNPSLGTTAVTISVPNAAVTGTTLNSLTKLTGAPSTAVIASSTDKTGAIGIAVSGAGTTGSVQISTSGESTCIFDGPTTANDYATISPTIGGDCHDAGSSYPINQVVGRVLSTNGTGGTYSLILFGPETEGFTYNSLTPMTTMGDLVYESAANTSSRLAGNTTATNKFLTQTGTGTVSAAPAWNVIGPSDLPLPTSSTLGGTQSKTAVSHQWLNTISTSGVPGSTQPAAADLSDGVTGTGTVAMSTSPVLSNPSLGTTALTLSLANAGSTGTTVNKLAKLTGAPSTAVISATTDTSGIVGVVLSGAGTAGSAQIAIGGDVSCVFDNATTANDFVQISSTVAGDCHDAGSSYPASGQVVGRVLVTNGSVGTNTIQYYAYDTRTGGGGTGLADPGSNGIVQRTALNTTSAVSTTGSGNVVEATSPTLVTPNIGVATATAINGTTIPSTVAMLALTTPAFYVSPIYGNDSWTGLLEVPNAGATDGPVKTIGHAQALEAASGTVRTVILHAGVYDISGTLALTFSDSGSRWIAYPGETPILDGRLAGGITLTGLTPTGPTFEGLTFQNLGSNGISFNGAPGAVIRWNTFLNCKDLCINGGGTTNIVVDSNLFNGQGPTSNSLIELFFGPSGNLISRNVMMNTQSTVINVETGASDPAMNNNIIDRNVIINSGQVQSDEGALYMADIKHTGTGNKITNNIVNGFGGGSITNQSKCIYLDDQTANITVTGNTCVNAGQYGFQIHGGDHDTISNNIFDLSNGAELGFYQSTGLSPQYGMASNVISNNIVYSKGAFASTLWNRSLTGSDVDPTVQNNLYFSATGATIPNTNEVDSARVLTDPLFTQPSSGNYYLASTSPAYSAVGSGGIAWVPMVTDQAPLTAPPVNGFTSANLPSILGVGAAGAGAIPTIAAGTGAGTSPTVSVVAGSTTNRGGFNVTTGSGSPATSATLVTVTFVNQPTTSVFCEIYPTNSATSVLAVGAKPFRSSAAGTASFVVNTGTTALATATAYTFGYTCF